MKALARGVVLAWLLAGCGAGSSVSAGEEALGRGDLVSAELSFRKALEADPERLEALYGLGWTLHLAGERDLARSSFQRTAEVHPESPLGWKGLGSVAMAEGNVPLARKRFGEALERAPQEPGVRLSLALLELGSGDAETGLRALDALASDSPARAEVQLARAEALLRLKRPEEARSSAEAAVAQAPNPRLRAQALVMRARVLLASAAGRVRAEDCTSTLPPVLAWLSAADASLDEAEALQPRVPDLVEVRRVVRAQRGHARDTCPESGRAPDPGAGGYPPPATPPG